MTRQRPHGVMGPDGEMIYEKRCVGQFPDGCGATTVDYQERLNTLLVRCLAKFYRYELRHGPGATVNARHDLEMSFHEWENFPKLRYFRLIEKSFTEDGKRIAAHWHITDKGVRFMTMTGKCYPIVWTWRGEPIEFEGKPVDIKHTFPEVWTAEDYIRNARPHVEEEDDDGR